MAFDAKEYRKRVLAQFGGTGKKQRVLSEAIQELNKNSSLRVPSGIDLVEFYDVPSGLSESQRSSHIASVVSAMKTAAGEPLRWRQPLQFHELIVARNPNFTSEEFWDNAVEQRRVHEKAALDEFGANAAAEYKVLGVVTGRQLREMANGSGVPDTVSDAELARVVHAQDVTVVPEFPAVSVPAHLIKEISAGLRRTVARSVLSVIFVETGEPENFQLLDGFRSASGSHLLTLSTVTSAYRYTESRADTNENDAFQKILAALKNSAASDADLASVVIAHFVDLGRQTFKDVGTKRGALRALVDRTGLDETDAGRILLNVVPAGATQQRGYPEVQALVAEGKLKQARRLYEALYAEQAGSETGEQEKALQALRGTEAKVDELRRRAREAQTSGDLETAAKALNEALTICGDDETLAAAARALPPDAPIRLVASLREDARLTTLSWEPGFGSSDDVAYQVIRKLGSPPRNNTDGIALGGPSAATAFVDTKPPIAVTTYYGVSASRGGGASPVAVAEVLALPPVADVVVTAEPSSLTLRWTTPPEASTIEVVQTAPDGALTSLTPGAQSSVTANGLRMGATYTYLLTAIYVGTSGERHRSATVRTIGVPRGSATAVREIRVSASAATGTQPEVVAEWAPVEGYVIEIWHYAQKPGWLFGTRLGMSEVRAQGAQLAGRSIANDAREGVRGATGSGLRYYVAITRDGESGLVGAVQPFGSSPPIDNLRAERFGAEAVLSWDWPGPEYEVHVRWTGATTGERMIAMNEYRTEGGCRVPLGAGGGTVEVCSVAGEGDARWMSSPTTLTVHGTATAVEYDIDFQRRLFGAPAGAILTFSIFDAAASIDVVIVARYDKWMPTDASQGSTLKRTTITASSPLVEVSLPRGPKGPVWVRAFSATPGARLIDPLPTRMKVD